jgi:hypothetical protein
MLPLRAYQPLPLPSFDDSTLKGLSDKGYAWAEGEVKGVRFRWLSPRSWSLVGRLPEAGGGHGFVPAMAFVDKGSGATAALRYSPAAWELDPGDLLDVADPRPFERANAYTLGETLVAERAGHHDSLLVSAAAYRRGTHVFLVTSEGPLDRGPELMEALGVLNSGLRIDAVSSSIEADEPHALKGLGLGLRLPARSVAMEDGETAVVTTTYGQQRATVLLRRDRSGRKAAEVLALEEKAVGGVRPDSLRFATAPPLSPAFAAPVLIENLDTADGRELALVAGPLARDGMLVARALYPAAATDKAVWLAARHALGKLMRSVTLAEP